MAIAPNTTFVAGNILTAAQQNAFGFSTVALSSATSNYALTTSIATTGLSVTFTAIANRNYKITWYEPQCQITNIASGTTTMQLRVTNAAGTLLQQTFAKNASTISGISQVTCQYIGTFSAGSVTIVGCASTTSLSDAPALGRAATSPAQLLVEDIGPS
jgi:hypothetical protein